MAALEQLEDRLRRLMEAPFLRLRTDAVQPVEVARAVGRELVRRRVIGVSETFAPNRFRVSVSPDTWRQWEAIVDLIRAELERYVSRRAEELGCRLPGEVQVDLERSDELTGRQLEVQAEAVAPRSSPAATSSSPPETGAWLRVVWGENQGAVVPVPLSGLTLGRDPECDLRLTEQSASRRHAWILHREAGFLIRDLGSTNGTLVNDERITEQRLQPGDRIAVGATVFEFQVVHTV